MKPNIQSAFFFAVVPTALVSLLFYFMLGHRRDYLGHYAAGYGGTLSALAIALAMIPASKFPSIVSFIIVPVTILCIGAGTVTEATAFRLAKFDEIDYCNQNLGAVIAGLAMVCLAGHNKPSDVVLRCLIAIGVTFLVMGAYFAFT